MAFYNGIEDEEENGNAPEAVGPESSVIGGTGGSGSGEPGGAGSAPKPEPFVGISKYIEANKPQSEKLANQVVGKIDEKAAVVDTALGSAQNSFNQAADSQKVLGDDDLVNSVKTNAAGVVADPSKSSSFAKLRDASYGGPQKLEDVDGGNAWGGIQSALQKAKDAKAASGTEAGRMGLIKEVSNNARQSQGGLVFDNLLLQSNPNSADKLKNAGASLNDVDQRLAGANQLASGKAAEIKAQNEGIRNSARGALTEGYSGLSSDLSSREATADAEQLAQVNALKGAIQSGQLSPDQLLQLQMNSDDRTYGADLSQFVNYEDGVDKYSVANQDDLARQNALKSLAGDMDLGENILNSSNSLGQKGKGFKTDLAGFGGAKDTAEKAYTGVMTDPEYSMEIPVPDGNGGYMPRGAQNKRSLDQLIKDWSGTTSDRGKAYLNDILLPARAKLMSQYNYKQTLGQGIPKKG